jgi:YD repeat-containing protein
MAYDALNRATSLKEPNSVVLTYGFDAASQQTLRQDSFGGVLISAYDAARNQTSIQFGGAGVKRPVSTGLFQVQRRQFPLIHPVS